MNSTFQHWLSNQKQRQDSVGKLARAMAEVDYGYVQKRRKPDEHKKWADIVTRHGEPKHVLAFNQAWREYQISNGDDGVD
jgi:hypothetical protein